MFGVWWQPEGQGPTQPGWNERGKKKLDDAGGAPNEIWVF